MPEGIWKVSRIKKLSSFDTGREPRWEKNGGVNNLFTSEGKVGVPSFPWISHEESWAADPADQVRCICDRNSKQNRDYLFNAYALSHSQFVSYVEVRFEYEDNIYHSLS